MDPASAAFVGAAHRRPRSSPISLIALHSTEGGEGLRSAEDTAAFFASGNTTGSAHFCVDPDSMVRCAHDSERTNGAGGVNDFSLHIEMCGTAHQTREQWLDDASRKIISNTADIVRYWLRAYPQLKPTFLTAADLRAGRRNGLTDHISITSAGFPSNDGHWDPGPNFPWDVLLKELGGGTTPIDKRRRTKVDSFILTNDRQTHYFCFSGPNGVKGVAVMEGVDVLSAIATGATVYCIKNKAQFQAVYDDFANN